MSHEYSVASITEFAARALVTQGVPEGDARLTARALVQADQRGINSHGVLRLPLYVEALRQGGIEAEPRLELVRDNGATAVLDGGGGLGQVVMQRAVDWSLERAAEFGICSIAVQNSSHYGAGSFWTDQLSARGMIGFLTSTTGPTVAVHGGESKVIGTNPLTIAVPANDGAPLAVDMATSAGAFGKVIAARQSGEQLPEGWAVDSEGRATTDPAAAAQGSLLAFGGHKGSGLAVLLEALSGSLSTATFAHQTQDIWDNPASRMNNGHFLIALDSEAFGGRSAVEDKVGGLKAAIRSSGRDVLLPGEKELNNEAAHEAVVPLSDGISDALSALAENLGLEPPR